MNKVRVLVLSGCKQCHNLTTALDALNISYVPLDADINGNISDDIEILLGTINYPIVTVERPPITTHLYRADDASKLGFNPIDHHTNKMGFTTVEQMVQQIETILNT